MEEDPIGANENMTNKHNGNNSSIDSNDDQEIAGELGCEEDEDKEETCTASKVWDFIENYISSFGCLI